MAGKSHLSIGHRAGPLGRLTSVTVPPRVLLSSCNQAFTLKTPRYGLLLHSQSGKAQRKRLLTFHVMWTAQDVNNTKITPEEIIYLVTEMSRLKEAGGEPCFETAAFILSRHLEDEKLRDRVDKAFCIMERMRCLSLVANDDRMRAGRWTPWTLIAGLPMRRFSEPPPSVQ